jgi:hypothetical protein
MRGVVVAFLCSRMFIPTPHAAPRGPSVDHREHLKGKRPGCASYIISLAHQE